MGKQRRTVLLLASLLIGALFVAIWFGAQKYSRQHLRLLYKTHAGMNLLRLKFTPDGKWLVGANSFQIALWDVATGQLLSMFNRCHDGFDISYNGKFFAVGANDSVELWKFPSWKKLWTRRANHWGTIKRLNFSPDGQFIATSGSDSLTVKLWRVKDGGLEKVFWVKGLIDFAFSPDGQVLATSRTTDSGYEVLMWDVSRKNFIGVLKGGELHDVVVNLLQTREQMRLKFGGQLIGFSPDGELLAAREAKGVRVWDVTTCKQVGLRKSWSFGFHTEGIFVTIDQVSFAHRWHWHILKFERAEDFKIVGAMFLDRMPSETSASLEFSPDRKRVAVWESDGTIWLFERREKR